MLDIKIEGLAALHQQLQDLPAKIEANVLRGALRTAGKVLEQEAKRLCPIGDPRVTRTIGGEPTLHTGGDLRDSIRVSVRLNKGRVIAKIRAGSKKAWYAHLVEYGTAAHYIMPKYRKSLFFAGLQKEIVHHPGARRKPFMRPAFDSKWRDAVEAAADYIRQRLPRELKKVR